MNISSLIRNFDSLYFDAKSSSLSLIDIDKMVEEEVFNKIIITNWNKQFINENLKIIHRIMSKVSVSFSLIGSNAYDLEDIKKLTDKFALSASINKFELSQYISLSPWMHNKDGVIKWSSSSGNISNYFYEMVSSTNLSFKRFLITFDKTDGIFKSNLEFIKNISGLDRYLISNYSSYLSSKGAEALAVVSLDDVFMLEDNHVELANNLKSIGIGSVLLVFTNNINKKNTTYDEYDILRKVQKILNVYIYGFPFDGFGNALDDLDRFKWVIDVNNISKTAIKTDQFNKNNLYYI